MRRLPTVEVLIACKCLYQVKESNVTLICSHETLLFYFSQGAVVLHLGAVSSTYIK